MAAEEDDLLSRIDNLLKTIENYDVVEPSTSVVATDLTVDEKMELITQNLGEIMNHEACVKKIREIISERPLRIYWGTATTGAPHIAYFIPLTKLGDFLKAGCEVTILLADVHAFLDAAKSPWELVDQRVKYYKAIISAMLRAVDVPIDRLKFVRGKDFQLTPEYTLDVYRMCSKTSVNAAQNAGQQVVKQSDNPALAPILYPLLQALDEEYLKVDAQFGGVDQRKIFAFASDYLKKYTGYPSRIHLMNPICPGLGGGKMSSSEKDSKIDPLETSEEVWKKLKRAFCCQDHIYNKNGPTGGEVNGVLSFFKFVVFTCFLKEGELLSVKDDKAGTVQTFKTYQELEDSFGRGEIAPVNLKLALSHYLNRVLDRVRAEFDNPEMQELREKAYPPEKKEAVEMSTEAKWIFDFFKEHGEYPDFKVIRKELSISKNKAKQHLRKVKSMKI